jgi:hypothetical protein
MRGAVGRLIVLRHWNVESEHFPRPAVPGHAFGLRDEAMPPDRGC